MSGRGSRKPDGETVLAVIIVVVGLGLLIWYAVALNRPGSLVGALIGLPIGLGLLWWWKRRQRLRRNRREPD